MLRILNASNNHFQGTLPALFGQSGFFQQVALSHTPAHQLVTQICSHLVCCPFGLRVQRKHVDFSCLSVKRAGFHIVVTAELVSCPYRILCLLETSRKVLILAAAD